MEVIQVDVEIKFVVKVQLFVSLVDVYNKMVSVFKCVLFEILVLVIVMEVFQCLVSFICEWFLQYVQVFVEVLELFGEIIVKEIG